MVSKKQLLAEVHRLQASISKLVESINEHVDEALSLGHAQVPHVRIHPGSVAAAKARLNFLRLANVTALQADNAELRAKLAAAEEAAAQPRVVVGVDPATPARSEAEIRRETLKNVIEALELDQYRDRVAWFFRIPGTPSTGEGIDRFWADITTTLRVRAEDAEAEADEAAEARIAAITRRAGADEEVYSAGETIIDSNGRDL